MLNLRPMIASLMLVTGVGQAAEPAHEHEAPAPSKQMRRDMADALDKAASCLRADRSFEECRVLIAMAQAANESKHCMMMNMKDGKNAASQPEDKHEH